MLPEQRKRKLASQYSEKLHQRLESLSNELEMTVKRLDKQEAQHDLERKNLLLEKEKVKRLTLDIVIRNQAILAYTRHAPV